MPAASATSRGPSWPSSALLAIVGGYTWWRQSSASRGTDLFATALAVYQAPVVPLPPPTPGGAPPVQQPGTYLTEQSKLEAALPKFIEAADKYPATPSGIAARYHAASILATLGRYPEAEQRFQEVVTRAGSTLYARTGRLGLAEVQVAQKKYDNAITIYTEMSRDTSSQMPVDGVLMQLGRALRARRPEGRSGPRLHARHGRIPDLALRRRREARAGRGEEVIVRLPALGSGSGKTFDHLLEDLAGA